MKKISLILLVSLFSLAGFSQEKGTNDLSVAIGVGTSNEFFNIFEDVFTGLITSANYTNESSTPPIIVTYKRAIKNNWFLYADGSIESEKKDLVLNNDKIGDVSRTYLTFGFGTEYHYIVKEWFQMYSGGSIALSSASSKYTDSLGIENQNDTYVNFQINALGFRFGKSLAAVAEFGVGYKGFGSFGLSYQF